MNTQRNAVRLIAFLMSLTIVWFLLSTHNHQRPVASAQPKEAVPLSPQQTYATISEPPDNRSDQEKWVEVITLNCQILVDMCKKGNLEYLPQLLSLLMEYSISPARAETSEQQLAHWATQYERSPTRYKVREAHYIAGKMQKKTATVRDMLQFHRFHKEGILSKAGISEHQVKTMRASIISIAKKLLEAQEKVFSAEKASEIEKLMQAFEISPKELGKTKSQMDRLLTTQPQNPSIS